MTMRMTVEQATAVLPPSTDHRDQLLSKLRGQTAHIPDLKSIFADWKGVRHLHISPWVEHLRKTVDDRIQRLGFSHVKQKRLKNSDFALFTALWWPEASLERLQILSYLIIWLFTWDDEIDEPIGAYSEDLGGAQAYRDQTLRFVGEWMGLVSNHSFSNHHPYPLNGVVQSFDVIGSALRPCYDAGQSRRFFSEISRFMKASEAEQLARLRGEVPTMDEYWAFRLGASAVYITSAVGEYSMATRLPAEIMGSVAMRELWDETNIIISITNDLLSLRKEIRLGCIDSFVPLTFASTQDIDEAVSLAVTALRASKARFDQAAQSLLTMTGVTKDIHKQVEDFIQIQRSNCVGNLVWSLETQRYDVSGVIKKDRSLQVIL
ncbi:isoprenoid synthase domain-containing protein [Poronia punctata]|nr:isoprenoid synthase domain-containing protein [Poronia punctata]